MSLQQGPINLYIHPDEGPTTSMPIDLVTIELAVIHSDVNANRESARVDALITLIKGKFPKVQPEESRAQLRILISRLAQFSIYDGIVLRLPGTIESQPPLQSYSKVDVEEIEEVIQDLDNQLQSGPQNYDQDDVDELREAAEELSKQLRRENLSYSRDVVQKLADTDADLTEQLRNKNLSASRADVQKLIDTVKALADLLQPGPHNYSKYSKVDVQKLADTVEDLTEQLRNERASYDQRLAQDRYKDKKQIDKLADKYTILNEILQEERALHQEYKDNLEKAYKEEKEKASQATEDFSDCRKQKAILEEEKAKLEVELNREQRDSRLVPNLRQQIREARDTEKQLRVAYSRLEQENKELREKLRRLAEDLPEPNMPSPTSDGTKGPWLD